MSKIENLLKANGLAINNLPKSVTEKIDLMQNVQADINAASNELQDETDADAREEMRATILRGKNYVSELEEQIALQIQTLVAEQRGEEDGDDERERQRAERRKAIMEERRAERNRAKMQAAASQNVNASATQLADGGEAPKRKNGKALAWIFGGVVLVLTLGAVNTMSNK
jgi:neutral trehalase